MSPPRTARDSRRLDFAGLAKTEPPTTASRRVAARLPVAALLTAASLAAPAAAGASLVDEQRQGRHLIAQLPAGTKTCRELSAEDFDHVDEYAM